MTVDLKWCLPVVVPFVMAAVMRGMLWIMGAPMSLDFAMLVALLGGFFGMLVGFLTAVSMSDRGICWTVRIGSIK